MNKDVYEQEFLKQAIRSTVVVKMALTTRFFVTQIFTSGGVNWRIWLAFLGTQSVPSKQVSSIPQRNWHFFSVLHWIKSLKICSTFEAT